MPQSLKSFIGVVLLVLSVGVTSCQALISEGVPAMEIQPAPTTEESSGD